MYFENGRYIVFNGIEIFRKEMTTAECQPLFYVELKFDSEVIETVIMANGDIQMVVETMRQCVFGVLDNERHIAVGPYETEVIKKAGKVIDEFREKKNAERMRQTNMERDDILGTRPKRTIQSFASKTEMEIEIMKGE